MTKIDSYLEQYDADNRKTWRNRPEGLFKVANIGGNYPTVWLYKQGKTAKIAVGCRRFTIEHAYDHWGSLDNVYRAWRANGGDNTIPSTHQTRAARADAMSERVVAQCSRKARRLGWDTGGY